MKEQRGITSTDKQKILVAISGGVDSSIATALLLEAGFDCSGVFMITNDQARHAQADAEDVAKKFGIELYILDLRPEFEEVIEYFCSEYKSGRTPNPCVFCNRRIKFGRLLDFARSKGIDLLATGHYAQIIKHNDTFGLYEADHADKDQSYVLTQVRREVLSSIILPMGGYNKKQTREMARELGLANSEKADSQEICFIPDDDYVRVLEERCPEMVRKGKIVNSEGKELGEHSGVHRYTIGQRRGLGIAMGIPYYVTKIDAVNNEVTLGPKEEVMHSKLTASCINWLVDEPTSEFQAKVRVRYNDNGSQARVIPCGDSVIVEFDRPKSAITPGQLAAFYTKAGDLWQAAGSAWIDNVSD